MDCAASAIVYSISSLVSEVRAFSGKASFRSRYMSGFSYSMDEEVGVVGAGGGCGAFWQGFRCEESLSLKKEVN